METLNELYTKRDELRKELESVQCKINAMGNEEKDKIFIDFYNKIKDQYVEIDLADGDKVFGYVVYGDATMSVIKLTNVLKICGDVFFFIPQSGFYTNEFKSLDAKILTLGHYKSRVHEIIDKYLPK